ncbi:MAG: FKBP-type peptidyl-prolyl cis-trans isomerase [Thermoanaerobaculia bacterium]
MKKLTSLLLCGAAALLWTAPAPADEKAPPPAAPEKKESKMVKTPSGLQYEDMVVGTGASPKAGQTCVMNYTGWLWENGQRGKKFDSSVGRGPFSFKLGMGQVIKGWDEGVATMKVGGKRTLLIPPDLGYGARGTGGGLIPPNATLIFDVELVGIK